MLDTSKYVNTSNPDLPGAPVDDAVLRRLFVDARTHNGWLDLPVDDATLRRLYELARLGPTSANTQPLRLVFAKSIEAKRRLAPALSAGNLEKTMSAPVTAIVAHDLAFYEHLPRLFPHTDAKSWFAGAPAARVEKVAVQGATLQAAYLIIAARALGLDVGPIGGFDAGKVDDAFFAGTSWRTDFLVNLGHGDVGKLFPRSPRLEFDEACRIE